MMNNLLSAISFSFCCIFSTANAQDNPTLKKIEYEQGCSFCAGERFTSTLYVYEEGAFYNIKLDESYTPSEPDQSIITNNTTRHIRYDLKSDSIFELGAMRSINPQGIIIAEKRKPIDWNLLDSSRVINGHSCKLGIGDFRGRQYYAWYDPSIKISKGPWKLHGLPGAIVYAEDTTRELYFKALNFIDLKGTNAFQIILKPDFPVVARLRFRAMREEIYAKILNIKPGPESNSTYQISIKKNYFEFE